MFYKKGIILFLQDSLKIEDYWRKKTKYENFNNHQYPVLSDLNISLQCGWGQRIFRNLV